MDATSQRELRVLWSFWIACGLAVTGAILPLLLAAGGTNRIAGAAIPFGVAAMAFAAAALLYSQGRPVATALYFIGGLALVYGMLSMIAVPLRLAVIGTCDPAPAICPAGFERPMSGGEDSGLAIGVAMGTLAILVGFFGLRMLFRLRPQAASPPPTRIEKPWVPPAAEAQAPAVAEAEPPPAQVAVAEAEPPPAQVAVAPAEAPVVAAGEPAIAASKPARKPRAKSAPKPQAELAAPVEPKELAAPEEPLELPAPDAGADADTAG